MQPSQVLSTRPRVKGLGGLECSADFKNVCLPMSGGLLDLLLRQPFGLFLLVDNAKYSEAARLTYDYNISIFRLFHGLTLPEYDDEFGDRIHLVPDSLPSPLLFYPNRAVFGSICLVKYPGVLFAFGRDEYFLVWFEGPIRSALCQKLRVYATSLITA